MHRIFIFYTILIIVMLCGGLYYSFLNLDKADWIMLKSEGKALEISTAVIFALSAFVGFIGFLKTNKKMHFLFFTLMALASAREMDLHKEWTTDSILKLRFYSSDTTPEFEKLIGGVVILFLLYASFQCFKRIPLWISNLWMLQDKAWAIAFGMGALVIAKSLDSMKRLVPKLTEFHTEHHAFLGLIEESLEMAGAMMFLYVAFLILQRR